MTSANVDVIRRLNAAFNAGDLDRFRSLLDPDVEFVDHLPLPDIEQSARGIDQVTKVLDQWRQGFIGFHADVEEYIDLDDCVVCSTRWKFTSRDRGIELEWVGAEAHQLRGGKLIWSAAGFRDVRAAVEAVESRQTT